MKDEKYSVMGIDLPELLEIVARHTTYVVYVVYVVCRLNWKLGKYARFTWESWENGRVVKKYDFVISQLIIILCNKSGDDLRGLTCDRVHGDAGNSVTTYHPY